MHCDRFLNSSKFQGFCFQNDDFIKSIVGRCQYAVRLSEGAHYRGVPTTRGGDLIISEEVLLIYIESILNCFLVLRIGFRLRKPAI